MRRGLSGSILLVFVCPFLSGQIWISEGPKILASNNTFQQGHVLLLSKNGKNLFVSARADEGAVWVLNRKSRTDPWNPSIKLNPPDTQLGFGSSIALSDDEKILVIGEPGYQHQRGAIRVFSYTDQKHMWNFQKTLQISEGGSFEELGTDVAISWNGELIAGGAPTDSSLTSTDGRGSVFIFKRQSQTSFIWNQEARIALPNNERSRYFGSSVAMSNLGDILAISAGSYDYGGVWVAIRNGSRWTSDTFLMPIRFCVSGTAYFQVALNGKGDILALSETSKMGDNILIFTRQIDNSWINQQGPLSGGGLRSVDLSDSGDILVIGRNLYVTVFRRNETGKWNPDSEGQRLSVPTQVDDPDRMDNMRVAVSGDGKEIAIGSFTDNGSLGATWLFRSYAKRQPVFQTYFDMCTSVLADSFLTTTFHKRNATKSKLAFPPSKAYGYAPSTASTTTLSSASTNETEEIETRIVNAEGTVSITFCPVLNISFYLYAYNWPAGQYIFSHPFIIKSGKGGILVNGRTLYIQHGPLLSFSGIMEFSSQVTSIQWSAETKNPERTLEYTLATIGLTPS